MNGEGSNDKLISASAESTKAGRDVKNVDGG